MATTVHVKIESRPRSIKTTTVTMAFTAVYDTKTDVFASISAVLRRFNTLSNMTLEGNLTSLVEDPYTAVSVSYCAI